MFGKKYKLVLELRYPEQVIIAIGMEGRENLEVTLDNNYPKTVAVQKARSYPGIIIRSARYSRMGILNYFVKV